MTKFSTPQKIILHFALSFCILIFVFCIGNTADAVELKLESDKVPPFGMGQQFQVDLVLDTENEEINAVEGKVIFPEGLLELKEIRDGNSIINFWIEKPKNQNGTIIFSGITPGGFNSEKGLILSVIFEAKKEGVAKFEINDARVLRNDGTGSAATLTIAPFEIAISSEAPAETAAVAIVQDTELPESFVPEISKDESIANGKWFVVFATQDKASGIDHYEVKESRQRILSVFGRWVSAESPYVLTDQELRSYVLIKAVDKVGNEKVMEIVPKNPLAWYENYENWVMIIAGVFILALTAKKIWRKK